MPAIENLAERVRLAGPDPAFRLAPHNIEAEQALLGAILVNNDAFDRVSDFLKAEHFSEEVHRRIFDVAAQLIRAGKLASPIMLGPCDEWRNPPLIDGSNPNFYN